MLFHSGEAGEALFEFGVGRDVVAHLAIVELLVRDHVEIPGPGQAEHDGLRLAGLAALFRFVDGSANRVAALRRRQDACGAREHLRRGEHGGLLHGDGFHISVVVELGQDGAHAVVAQTARVVGGRNEAAAERVHLRERADSAGVAEVVRELAAREARAGRRFDRDDAVVGFAAEFFAHERGDQAAEVGTAAGAADDDVRLDAVLTERGLRFQADDALMQQDLRKDGSEYIAVAFVRDGRFHGLGDRAAETARGAGELRKDAASGLGRFRRRRRDGRAVGAHDLAAERLLFVGALHHVDVAVEAEERAGHGERRAPLPRAGLGRDALQALLLRVVSLRDGGVQLVAAGRVVALELVVDLRGGLQRLFQKVRADQRRRTVHLVEVEHLVRNRDLRRIVVEFLLHQLIAEHVPELLRGHRLTRSGIQQRRGLGLHVGADVVPRLRQFVLGEIDLVRDMVAVCGGFVLHGSYS